MRAVMLVLILALASGCVRTGKRVDQGQLLEFEEGKTTYYEVKSALGKPTQDIRNDDKTRILVYAYTQQQNAAANYIPFYRSFASASTAESTTTVLYFNANDILVRHSFSEGYLPTGYGIFTGGRQ